jgi:DNA mismatch repair protein MutS
MTASRPGKGVVEPTASVLFDTVAGPAAGDAASEPDYFADLNLDQVVYSITSGLAEYRLDPFFYAPLASVETIAYRHDAFRDLENATVAGQVSAFAERMRGMRRRLARAATMRHPRQRQRWFLDAVDEYCRAVTGLAGDLGRDELCSRALIGFRDYLTGYAGSGAFTELAARTRTLLADLATIRYSVTVRGSRVRVDRYHGEIDYSAQVLDTFERFRQGSVRDYRIKLANPPDMNHVEARILDLVARLYPEAFTALAEFGERHRQYLDPTVAAFDREIQFYLGYLAYIAPLKRAGLPFCYPTVSRRDRRVRGEHTFDLALAHKLVSDGASVVCNDFHLDGPERIVVVTGPNQGGKTTFARAFGQLHHLASLGCPVPGTAATSVLFDQLFTHFQREEDPQRGSGKLHDDLLRFREILERATGDSVLVMNEAFVAMTLRDAVYLGTRLLDRVIRLGMLCVGVTFVDELASLGPTTVSMVATVVPEDPATRTYRVVRRPADGLAYAEAIAEKYDLTYDRLAERLRP